MTIKAKPAVKNPIATPTKSKLAHRIMVFTLCCTAFIEEMTAVIISTLLSSNICGVKTDIANTEAASKAPAIEPKVRNDISSSNEGLAVVG